MDILKEKPISFWEAKKILLERSKESDKLGYEQKITLDYLRKFSFLTKTQTEDIKNELEGLGFLKDYQVIMIMNMKPKTKDDLKVLFMKERQTLDEGQMEKILNILGKVIQITEVKKKEKGKKKK